MVYAVDLVENIMHEIGILRPVMFQRDNRFFTVSGEGFAQISYGLQIVDRPGFPIPEAVMEGSTDAMVTTDAKKSGILETELERFMPILFGSDDDMFSLRDMAGIAGKLQKLDDDGKIRMVSHDSRYHSHKHGYACDGIDVWTQAARVMDREKYFELMRKEEDEMLERMASVESNEPSFRGNLYENLLFPEVLIMTPNILVSFPRGGVLESLGSRNVWATETRFGIYGLSGRDVLRKHDVDTFERSPFDVSLSLNAQGIMENAFEVYKKAGEIAKDVAREVRAICSEELGLHEFVQKWNEAHNKLCAANIAWREEQHVKSQQAEGH